MQYHNPHQRAPKVVRAAAGAKAALPTREEVLAFIGGAPAPNGERAPARVTKRDIARAFGVKGEAKAELKLLIKDLQAEGAIARGRKSLQSQGRLPTLVVADIAELDRNGELIAKPAEWSEDAPPPRILMRRSRAKRDRAPAPGLGARVLDASRVRFRRRADGARLFGPGDQDPRQGQGARFRRLSRCGPTARAARFRSRSEARRASISCPPAWPARRGTAISSRVEPLREGRLALPSARVVETIGSVKSERAVSLIALATHHIPHVFSPPR